MPRHTPCRGAIYVENLGEFEKGEAEYAKAVDLAPGSANYAEKRSEALEAMNAAERNPPDKGPPVNRTTGQRALSYFLPQARTVYLQTESDSEIEFSKRRKPLRQVSGRIH